MGKHPPGTATTQYIQYCVENCAHVRCAWSATWFGFRYQRLKYLPFSIVQITGICLLFHNPVSIHYIACFVCFSDTLSDIANAMDGNYDANYKAIQRFIEDDKPGEAMHRLYNEDCDHVLGDPTDIERPQAVKTDYVGKLKNGKLGFTILFLATPYVGRAI